MIRKVLRFLHVFTLVSVALSVFLAALLFVGFFALSYGPLGGFVFVVGLTSVLATVSYLYENE